MKPGFFAVVFKPQPCGGWRYVIESYPDGKPVSRLYVSRPAMEKHTKRLIERGWQWAAEYDKQQQEG